ncbi:MAG: hypothetical protein LBV27_08580 [Oscillospiraceae bacterium]|jgi:predicted small lipoprotein YifL|nr:hypothetical protein [Oscillospiraceae bacterium]
MKTSKTFAFATVFALMLSLAACGGEAPPQSEDAPPSSSESATTESTSNTSASDEPEMPDEPPSEVPASSEVASSASETPPDSVATLEDLVLNEYADLSLTAAVLERKAILPGSFVPIAVTVTNNGDQTISYVQGSGGYTIPDALSWSVPELTWVWPEDRLGAATSDFVTKPLAPGESVSFVVYVMTIEQNPEQFETAARELYDMDGTYIANMEWGVLQEKYPWMTPVPAGSYTGEVTFRYSIDDGSGSAPLSGPTGYAQTEITIGVTE